MSAPQIVLLFSGLTILSMGLLLMVVARMHPGHVKGMSDWGIGVLLIGITVTFGYTIKESVGLESSLIVSHTFTLIGLLIISRGVTRFYDEPSRFGRTTASLFLTVFVVGFIWFTLIDPAQTIRMSFFVLGGAIVVLNMLPTLYRHRADGIGVKILLVAVCVAVLSRIVKLLVLLAGYPVGESLFEASATQVLFLALPSIVVPVGTLAFTLMASERLIDQLNQTIRHDDLTGALNKSSLYKEIDREIVRSVRYRRPLTLMMIDLDNFKAINDSMGHLKGDQMLKAVVHQIHVTVRNTDLVARFGGDEFAVLLTETDIERTQQIAARVLQAIASVLPDYCGASIGISSIRSHGETVDSLLHRADQALYKAKQRGKNQVALA